MDAVLHSKQAGKINLHHLKIGQIRFVYMSVRKEEERKVLGLEMMTCIKDLIAAPQKVMTEVSVEDFPYWVGEQLPRQQMSG